LNVGTAAQVGVDDLVELRLTVTDTNGLEISEIQVGRPFQLRGFVKDLRDTQSPQPSRPGVFAAYQDILFNSSLVTANPDLNPFFSNTFTGSQYRQGKSGDVRISGLINELGSFQDDTSSPLGFGEKLQFVINFTAGSTPGLVNFVGDPADVRPFHDTLLFDPTTPLLPNQIRYTQDSVRVVSGTTTGGGGGGGEGFTNDNNAYDVNDDGFVSPIDVLILINSLNNGNGGQLNNGGNLLAAGEGSEFYYVDVNGDGFLDPLDVLGVINYLNTNSELFAAGEGEGEGSTFESGELPLVELPFQSLAVSSTSWIYGPAEFGDEEDETIDSLAEYLSQYHSQEDDEFLDGLATGLV
jgi:large repetitive protein